MQGEQRLKEIVNKKWYIQGFNACVNYIGAMGPVSAISGCWNTVGYGYTEQLLVFTEDYLEYFYLEDDLQQVGEQFLSTYQSNTEYLKELIAQNQASLAQVDIAIMRAQTTDLEKCSLEELLDIYHQISDAYTVSVSVNHVIEGITYVLEPRLKSYLEKHLKLDRHDTEFRKIFTALLQPAKPSFANNEHVDLLAITKMIVSDPSQVLLFGNKNLHEVEQQLRPDILQQIQRHREKYIFNQINYYHGEALSIENYLDEIQKLITDDVDIDQKIQDESLLYYKNIQHRKEMIAEYDFDQTTRDLIHLSIEVLHWQDDRKKVILECVYYMNMLLALVADSAEIDLELLKRYMPNEITAELLQKFPAHEAVERTKKVAVYSYRENNGVVQEVLMQEQFDALLEEYHKTLGKQNDLHGTCASTGKVSGVVRVCKTKQEIAEFQPGEILVAAMTRPEYVPAMRKSSAIITDEGGLTCHAAIVSRELSIPCIIATKHATKVLQSGDLVEVNASHGIIKIVRQKTR